ncbi:MAG: acyl-CoA dehydrogenase family protein [Sandaracinaceae bacterium]|nr:acyl-CoA dehydrogenase family protein [Sandaracinaceae bacterium]
MRSRSRPSAPGGPASPRSASASRRRPSERGCATSPIGAPSASGCSTSRIRASSSRTRRTDLDAAWLLTLRAAKLLDEGRRARMETSMAKLAASEACGRVVDRMVQLHGGYGYSREYLIERLYRDARVTRIYEGTNEIQRMVIARELEDSLS